jgi:Hg(II)-responsive transcriptional regulator
METYKIGEVAKMAQVNIETVRYYERQGLIPPPPRKESGYRQFPKGSVDRVKFIKRAQGLGFSLKEIAGLLILKLECATTCGDIKKLADLKITEIERKIESLNKIKAELAGLAETCCENGRVHECPILIAIES